MVIGTKTSTASTAARAAERTCNAKKVYVIKNVKIKLPDGSWKLSSQAQKVSMRVKV